MLLAKCNEQKNKQNCDKFMHNMITSKLIRLLKACVQWLI